MRMLLKSIRDVCDEGRFTRMSGFIQHGETTCMLHTIAVAYYSNMLVKKFKLKCRKQELVRGALLHDYFLYDWHDGKPERRIHGFTHPGTALENAEHDFELTELEKNIIVRHMFPLTPIPPAAREGWIVCAVDKACSVYEVFSKTPYSRLARFLRKNNINV